LNPGPEDLQSSALPLSYNSIFSCIDFSLTSKVRTSSGQNQTNPVINEKDGNVIESSSTLKQRVRRSAEPRKPRRQGGGRTAPLFLCS
jgi:hypothetical protein